MIKLLVLANQTLISKIDEVGSELGEPDCKLINPFCVNLIDGTLTPWLSDFTSQSEFMIHSDKILTIAEPNTKLLERYQKVTD
jgi:hypothetical protein